MQNQAKITSKGRVTVPIEVRRILGVRAGDRLLFSSDSNGVHIRPVRKESVFAKYAGIGNAGIGSGRKAINRWLRKMRANDGSYSFGLRCHMGSVGFQECRVRPFSRLSRRGPPNRRHRPPDAPNLGKEPNPSAAWPVS